MDLGIKGRVALVTGASRGLGLAIARELAREGARMALVARTKGPLNEAARSLEAEFGADVFPFPADVSTREGIHVMVTSIVTKMGSLSILINNTGGPAEGAFDRIDDEAWQTSFDGVFLSAVRASREVLPHMRRDGWGRIVNVLSVSARQPIPALTTSNALRAGLVGLTKSLAQEVGHQGITVNAVLPGFTKTRRLEELATSRARERGVSPDDIIQGWVSAVPVGRLGEPEDVGRAVVFLASEAASYITGTSLPVDGGYVKGLP